MARRPDDDLTIEHEFRPTRKLFLVNAAALFVFFGFAFFITGSSEPFGESIWIQIGRGLLVIVFLALTVLMARSTFTPRPRSIGLGPDGARVGWDDCEEVWPWESIRWEARADGVLSLASGESDRIFSLNVVPYGKLRLFMSMLEHYAGDSVARREAEALLAGEAVRLPGTVRWMGYVIGCATLLWPVCQILAMVDTTPPQVWRIDHPPFRLIFSLSMIVVTVALIWQTRRYLRYVSNEVRFLPEGIEERWTGGLRFVPYGAIERIKWQRSRWGGGRLIIQAGRQRLMLGQLMVLMRGARQLLRQRAVTATYEETTR